MRTLSEPSSGIYREKGSKFLSFALPVNNANEIKEHLAQFRKKYYDARHVCYAYVLGEARSEYRVSDDGEPSGTAGKPILGQINSFELTNVLIVVVRYFGGILLGTGGLVNAYKEAAVDALKNAEIVEKYEGKLISIEFPYLLSNEVSRLSKELDLHIESQNFDDKCSMMLSVSKDNYPKALNRLKSIYGLKVIEES